MGNHRQGLELSTEPGTQADSSLRFPRAKVLECIFHSLRLDIRTTGKVPFDTDKGVIWAMRELDVRHTDKGQSLVVWDGYDWTRISESTLIVLAKRENLDLPPCVVDLPRKVSVAVTEPFNVLDCLPVPVRKRAPIDTTWEPPRAPRREEKGYGGRRETCINCDKPLDRGREDRETCSDRCRQARHRRSTHDPKMEIETRSCTWCFRSFNCRKSSNQKFCHRAACKQADYRARMKAGRQVRF